MTVPQTHSNTESHRDPVPDIQIAGGSAASGDVPISNGDGTRTWGPAGGGGGASVCDHRHEPERFVAAGGSPETLTIAYTPLWGVRVYVQGLRADTADVTLAGLDVEVETTVGDVVLIDYERDCADGCRGGIIPDPPDLRWYYVDTSPAFIAETPGAWAPDTLYLAGQRIVESGFTFARVPGYWGMSDDVASEPNFAVVAEHGMVADLFGYWYRVDDAFDPASLPAWVANTDLSISAADVIFIVASGYVFCAAIPSGTDTGATIPDFVTVGGQAAGADTFLGGWSGSGFLLYPYVPGSVSLTIDGTPDAGFAETAFATTVELDAGTTSSEILVFSYTPDCP